MRGHPIRFTEEEKALILANYRIKTKPEIAKLLQSIGSDKGYKEIKCFMHNNNLTSGINAKFQKGHRPVNKGKKLSPEQYAKSYPTMFHKGHKPAQTKPVDSIRFIKDKRNKSGYWYRKIAEPNKWKALHIIEWEKHNGPVPKGQLVVFLDGNTSNISIDNLRLISKAENLLINNMGNMNGNAELKNVAVDIAKIKMAVKKYEK